MKVYKAHAIVLKRYDVGEADRLLTILTDRFGKRTVRARGVRKPQSKLGGHLEPLVLSELMYVEGQGGVDTVTGSVTLQAFGRLRSSLRKTAVALHLVEMVDRSTREHLSYPELFTLLVHSLTTIEKRRLNATLKPAFIAKLLQVLGFRIEVERCTRCGARLAAPLGFSQAAGGILGGCCAEEAVAITHNEARFLAGLARMPFGDITRVRAPAAIARRVTNLLEETLVYHAEVRLKSSAFYEEVTAGLLH